MSTTIEASEFYKIKEAKLINKNIKESKIETVSPSENHKEEQKGEEEEDSAKTKSKSRAGSFEFITNLFSKRKSSPSPNRSKSPNLKASSSPNVSNRQNLPNLEPSKLPLLSLKQIGPKSQLDLKETDQNVRMDVKEMIKSEMKKIVQIQHETLMRFLNNDPNEVTYNSRSQANIQQTSSQNIDQQIYSVLKQQKMKHNLNGEPVEFVIETKIKAVDSAYGGKETMIDQRSFNPLLNQDNEISSHSVHRSDNTNYFMKNFDKINDAQKSSFIKIPLLNTRFDSQKEAPEFLPSKIFERQETPQVGQKNLNPKTNLESGQNLLKLESVEKSAPFNKHIKKFIEETHKIPTVGGFPLLKFNYSRLV